MELSPVVEKFILHWGEMGATWGINRTVAQIQALLYITGRQLTADEIMETLGVARSNVSTSLKELQSWGLVRTVPKLGERRERYETYKDVWEMFQIVLAERKRREVDPTVQLLRECVRECEDNPEEDRATQARLGELLGFFETMTAWYDHVNRLPRSLLLGFFRMGDRIRNLVKPESGA